MSIKLMSFVWDLDLPQGRKLVLLSLADQANDAGQCFPSFETLQQRCGMSRRTLFDCLRDLEDGGLVTRIQVGQPGRPKVVFQVNEEALRQCDLLPSEPVAKSAPVQNQHQCEIRTSAKNSKTPVRNLHSIKQPSNSNQERGVRSPAGSRLPPDWEPSAEELDFARRERPELDIAAEVEKFRDYWHGTAGAKGRKADWPATWRNWIRRAEAPRAAPGQPVPGSTAPAPPQRDWREPSESDLERDVAYIRQQHGYGVYGDGQEADAERDRLIAAARRKHGEGAAA